MKRIALLLSLFFATACSACAQTFDPRDPRSPLHLIRTIELPNVKGRIDHMALDATDNHLFIAELGNGSVDDVDLNSGKVVGRISGLHEPQGVAWLPAHNEIAVACGDGTVHFYRGTDREEVARISLGDDADNERVDTRNGNLVVGFGSGALAIIDPSSHQVIRTLKLPAHPEAFELIGSRAFVNVPDAHAIIVGDLDQARLIRKVKTGLRLGNYPMASNRNGSGLAVAFRFPNSLSIIDARTGLIVASSSSCGDADDLYFRSRQLVVVCGSGAVELADVDQPNRSLTIKTKHGARTGLLDRVSDQLFVAVPADQSSASLWEFAFR